MVWHIYCEDKDYKVLCEEFWQQQDHTATVFAVMKSLLSTVTDRIEAQEKFSRHVGLMCT